jgi:GNAT superfamily N-acetyltransferase
MGYEFECPGGFRVSDDPDRLNLPFICDYIAQETYWGRDRPRAVCERAIRNSLAFGLYAPDGSQAGFGRVVSDRAIRAHLADVFVIAACRGQGLGKALVAAILGHPELASVTTWTLNTSDAHGLYAGFGFAPLTGIDTHMMRVIRC